MSLIFWEYLQVQADSSKVEELAKEIESCQAKVQFSLSICRISTSRILCFADSLLGKYNSRLLCRCWICARILAVSTLHCTLREVLLSRPRCNLQLQLGRLCYFFLSINTFLLPLPAMSNCENDNHFSLLWCSLWKAQKNVYPKAKDYGLTKPISVSTTLALSTTFQVLENRIEQALSRFNKALSHNKDLKEEIGHLQWVWL